MTTLRILDAQTRTAVFEISRSLTEVEREMLRDKYMTDAYVWDLYETPAPVNAQVKTEDELMAEYTRRLDELEDELTDYMQDRDAALDAIRKGEGDALDYRTHDASVAQIAELEAQILNTRAQLDFVLS